MYTTPPVVIFWVLEFITRGGIPWGCGIHRIPGDIVGGRFGILDYSPPRVVYRRGVITWGVITAAVSNKSCCHVLGRRGCDNNGCDNSGRKFSQPHSTLAAMSVIVVWGMIAPVAKEFRSRQVRYKAFDTGS